MTTEAVRISYTHDERIVQMKFANVERKTVDAWYNSIKNLLEHWPSEKPYLILYDMMMDNASLTPYLRQRSLEITQLRPDVAGRIAIAVRPSPTSYLMMAFSRLNVRSKRPAQVFTDTESALKWLEDGLLR